nr:putative RNA-dependent RNA polymerase [Lasiodiplodia ziziphi partitivirus 1]
MEYLGSLLSKLSIFDPRDRNFLFVGYRNPFSVFKPRSKEHDEHESTVLDSLKRHLYPWDYDEVLSYTITTPTNDDVEKDFFSGDIPNHQVLRDSHYLNALDIIITKFQPPQQVRPVHFADLRLYPWKWHPSAEAPFADHAKYLRMLEQQYQAGQIPDRRPSFGNLKDLIFGVVRQQLHKIKHGLVDPDAYLYYFRTHAKPALVKRDDIDPDTGKTKNKVRMIFGAPKTFILAEAMFFWPLFNYYQTHIGASPLLWGYETLNGGWLRLNEELNCSLIKGSILMVDWKRFDKYALFSVITDIMQGVRSYFNFNAGYIPTTTAPSHPNLHPLHPQWLENLWDWTCYARFNIPTLLPSGRVYQRLHAGIPSGMFTTNFLDSMYNGTQILTCLSSLGISVDLDVFIKLMGDDSLTRILVIIPTSQHLDFIQAMQDKASLYFNAQISIEKSKMSNRPYGSEVLSYVNNNGFPVRNYNELLARLLYTKSKRPRPEVTMAISIGIYYASAGNCSYLREVCLDVYTRYFLQGYRADKSALSSYFDPNFFDSVDIDFDNFPSRQDVQKRLTTFSERSEKRSRDYWPSWYFLDTF